MCQEHYTSHICTHRIYLGIWTCTKRSSWVRFASDLPCMEGTHIEYLKTLCEDCLSAAKLQREKEQVNKKRISFADGESAKGEKENREREEREQEHWRKINDEFWRYCEGKKTLPVTILQKWKPVRREEKWKWNVE